MDTGDWVQILSTTAVVSLISGGIQTWQNRHNVKAGTTQILTDAAGSFTERIMKRLQYLEEKDQARDIDDAQRDQLLRVHAGWDRRIVRRLSEALPDLTFEDPPPLHPEDLAVRNVKPPPDKEA